MNTTENKLTEEFNDYVLIHNFNHPESPSKSWINEDNFSKIFKDDWNSLMEVVEKIESIKGTQIFIWNFL
jgi:hypothetical protein